MLTWIDKLYIFDEFYYDMTNRVYFTHPAVSAKIYTDTNGSRATVKLGDTLAFLVKPCCSC